MKKFFVSLLSIVIFSTIFFAAGNPESYSFGNDDSDYIELVKINDNVWIHISYVNYNGYRTSSNGLVVITSKGLVLLDTPWTNPQTAQLIKSSEKVFKKKFALALITHAHDDRIGGIDTLLKNKIDSRTSKLTVKEALKKNYSKPAGTFESGEKIKIGTTVFETFYPGAGHTVDNMIIWLPDYNILYGGCIIKSAESKDIGNISEADTKQWPVSLKTLIDRYPGMKTVIPGHGKIGDINLIYHTLDLLKK